LDKATFSTNWILQAEHGRFYQAIATGIYKDHGLDINIEMGQSQVPSGNQLLIGDIVDFFIGYGIDAVKTIATGITKIIQVVIFHKDPMSHCPSQHSN
jgi:NitT/TauT family transport system substrate-binding protein